MAHGRPAKRRRITPPIDDDKPSETINASDLINRVADWDLEQDYEQRSRRKKVKESTRLPIKTAEGLLKRTETEKQSDNDSDSFLATDSEGDEEPEETPPTDDAELIIPDIPVAQQVLEAKEEIARLANLLNEDPEEHAGSFKKLAQVAGPHSHVAVEKLVLAAQAAVYKDVIPGYRIRAYNDEDLGSKVSKDIRRTRQYEHALITGYQVYVKSLTSLTKRRSKAGRQADLKTTALSCTCALLHSVPHFNFRTELLGILVTEVSRREKGPDFYKAVETLEKLFEEDEDGALSLEAVNLLSKMMRAVDFRVHEEVLNTFLHLRLLSELSTKSSATQTDKAEAAPKLHGRKAKKEKSAHQTKKERKIARERKAVEKDMQEANAAVDFEAREKMQSETLKAVFVTYFRILKARSPNLMGAVLEGLAKYAHLINQDFFGDILEALKDIVSQAELSISGAETPDDEHDDEEENADIMPNRNRRREALLSTQTAFTLLSQQEVSKSASALHLDLSFFTSHTYRSLYPLALDADIELGPKSLHLVDPHQASQTADQQAAMRSKVNVSTPVLLLTRALTSILLTPAQSQTISPQTLATFFKRLLTVTLSLPEKSCVSVLSILTRIVNKHGKKLEPLWYSDERKGDGVFNGAAESMAAANVFSVGSGVWEGELLRKHWVPQVREQWKETESMVKALAK